MRAVVVVESRFSRTPDGAVWTKEGPAYGFFTRYLSAFDAVRVVARVADIPTPVEGALRVDGTSVEVWPVPYYVGPRQYLRRWPEIRRTVCSAADDRDAVILRVPSFTGSLLAASRERRSLPYALEVMGDPHDVFAPGVVRHPLRPLLRYRYTNRLRQLCARAVAVSYVTDDYLQARYPAGQAAATAAYSSVDLPPAAYATQARSPEQTRSVRTLVSVGTLDQLYKGIDTLVEALARLAARGVRPRLVHVGDGRFRPQLERLAVQLGVAEQVVFAGLLAAGDEVRRQLDRADVFVMPSRTEGLPKALVEAMARGLPAIGASVGGIPELLPAEHLVPPGDPAALAAKLEQMMTDPAGLATASARNLARARDFSAESLSRRRTAFYQAVLEATQSRRLSGARASRAG